MIQLLTAWKVFWFGVFSGPYFLVFELIAKNYSVKKENKDKRKLRIKIYVSLSKILTI